MTVLSDLITAMTRGSVRVIDLTHTLDPDFPVIVLPADFGQCARFRMEEVSAYDHRGPAWKWHNLSMSEHTGTHFDAPIHWVTGRDAPNGATDSIDPGVFVGPVCVIDFSAESARSDDATLEPAHILAWEAEHGPIPADCWVLLRTDWSHRQGAAYLNLRDDGAHSPGPSPEAVRLLLERGIRGFGTETVGTDAGQAQHFDPPYPAHALIHGAGRYGLQCLRNLDHLPPTGAVLLAAPLKIKGGTGSPLRVLALIEEPAP
ncbi:MAG: cyclase family protein [Rhodobacteraceae bacterium]|jgi:kynurenine formamidase|nr:cyclase family protein [Paracoccaceae bacterium]